MSRRIMKAKEYSIYPNGVVYKGNKEFMTLTEVEYDFLSMNSTKRKIFYLENYITMQKDMEETGMPLKEAMSKMGYEQESAVNNIADCYHSFRFIKEFAENEKVKMKFYCVKCLEIKYIES